jgi:hypothetical protein
MVRMMSSDNLRATAGRLRAINEALDDRFRYHRRAIAG